VEYGATREAVGAPVREPWGRSLGFVLPTPSSSSNGFRPSFPLLGCCLLPPKRPAICFPCLSGGFSLWRKADWTSLKGSEQKLDCFNTSSKMVQFGFKRLTEFRPHPFV